jgi:Protein of unknown function (DUF2568)
MMANLVLRFIVEMTAYAALGYWGAANHSPLIIRVALAIFTPLAAMVLWSLLLAPKARWRLKDPMALVSELAIFTGAAIALGVSGSGWLSEVFIVVAVVNTLLVRVFERRTSASPSESTAIRSAG